MLADAMGHGVPAAMIMVMVKLIFKSLDCNKLTPGEVMSRINSRLAGIFINEIGEMFVTGVYMEYDKADGELVCCNAGHPPPLLFDGRGEVKKLTASNTPLGIMGDNNFRVEAIDAADFKEIFIYTDGLVDHISSKSPDLSQDHIDHIYKKIGEGAEDGGFTAFYRELKNQIDLNKGNDDITYMLLKID
ncbi:Stage II sporulation protein E (SpoIIE) [Halarsenatibacter silvermanii]|uniref:Stage II sporulation protein E (SpoIIE) n=1 Tax=Halarsenatibacter silvermanii TaxID=321763 RepID=A0A1G9IQI5_9FIRM|nr:Stage II sporulation protein E (SpoIIE) [Halarsenatibacter silvermanii]